MEREIRNVAVIDIGKTNAKLVLHDLETADDLAVLTTPNLVLKDGLYPHYDIDHLWRFILEGLAALSCEKPVDAISLTTHGASIALIGPDDLALPVLDYEYELDAEFIAAYRAERPDFSETQSPALPGGLNVGAQLAWLETRFPERFAQAETILTYPQYWAYRLTGVRACEVTQLGCHTDLWRPAERDFSSLVDRRGWRGKFAPLRSAFDELGALKPEIRDAMARDWDIPVFCGIHDSNASLLPHLMTRQAPFTVVSTGTWAILFAVGTEPKPLDKDRDTLANVDAFARPVPSARFMAGREFSEMAGAEPGEASREAAERVIVRNAMALPSFAKGTGPFPTRVGDWTLDPAMLDQGERTAAASLSAALTTETCLSLIGASGPIIVEGPFAKNTIYCDALEALTGQPVEAKPGLTGTAAGAALLARGIAGRAGRANTETKEARRRAPWPGLQDYAETWRRHVAGGRAAEADVLVGGE
ncbi:Sugar (pentulose or hexulose) kinase [Fulvimarina manganoxydans]|uniref:Sugar (Pentulose or hexulose) kinase n=1 Tax=Fulvimarina manganoxydans TaxID=937218 RepID=A0A1W2DKW3_9HYPH|nr:FGGY family carbohydrate kinase [Fulvimarina manganoxydans]SMC97668.1 Sugar (pentulose or hexulose) kinase [Fulvimarina manganoxydans]